MSELMIDLAGPCAHLFYAEFGVCATHVLLPDYETSASVLREGERLAVVLHRPRSWNWIESRDAALEGPLGYELIVIPHYTTSAVEPCLGLSVGDGAWCIYTARTVEYARKAGVLR